MNTKVFCHSKRRGVRRLPCRSSGPDQSCACYFRSHCKHLCRNPLKFVLL